MTKTMTMNKDYSDLLHVKTRKERLAMLRKPSEKWTMYPVTDNEVRQKLQAYGLPTSHFTRVGNNVVIADRSIVVIIKRVADAEPQAISSWDYPLDNKFWQYDLAAKNWANNEVVADFNKALRMMERNEL